MDSVVGEDPTLPLDFNGSSNVSRVPNMAGVGDSQDYVPVPSYLPGEKTSPTKARAMKEYENQITDLKKENFNLKLRIYFLEERMQQKFDDASEDIYKTNIELKVEVESLKRDLQEKQELLIKASKAVESLAGNNSSELHRMKERSMRELEKMKEIFDKKIEELEENLKAAQDDVEKMADIAEQEKLRNMEMEKQLLSITVSNPNVTVPGIDIKERLKEKDNIIEQLSYSLKNKGAVIEQLQNEKAKLEDSSSELYPLREQISELTEALHGKEGEAEALKIELAKEKIRYQREIQSLAEKHKELSNLEAATRQLTGDLESTRMMIDTLKKRLEEADEDNKNLNGRLEERVNELALEKKNSLKRDKTIQGLSLVLKDKDKEIEELCHEIEDRDNALVKAREAAHKAQIQKYQGAEEHQSLLTEKEAELAKLLSDHHANTMENQKLQRALGRRVQELSDLNQTKEQLEKELEDMQELKNKGDKDVNDLRNQLKKLNGEMAEKEHALEQQYQALLSESKQKVQSQEITIKRLTSSLNEKDELLQEYLNMAKDANQERNRSPDGRDAMLAKLRERLKEKEKALEQAIDEKFAAIEEKDNEIRQLQLSLREKERDLERLNNLLSHNEETINSFDSVIKEKDVELQHLVNSCKNLQRAKQELEDNLARALREKDAIISQLQQSLANKNKDMEEMANTLLNQTQSNVRDLTEQLRQRLKVTETMLAEAMKDKERLVSENQNAVEGLLATVGSKDQLLKESAEHYNRTLAERNLEIQDLRRHLSEKKHEVSILEKQSSVITHEKYIETAELKVLLTEKDTIINKLVESGQERDKYLAELKMQEAPIPRVLELKQTIQILQEQLEEKEAELTQKKGDVNVAKIPIIKKSAVTLKKELAQKTDDLNKALKKENELQIEVAELRSLLADLENRHEAQAANIESLTKTLDVKDEIIRDLHTRLGKPPKHNGVELQTQRGVVMREGIQSPGIPQRESTIIGGNSQQEALPALQTVLSEYDALNKALKAEQQLYSSLVRTVKEPDSTQRIHNLQMELTAVQLLRQKLEEGIRSNEDLRKDLEKELQRTKRKEVTDAQTGLIDPREMETLKHQLEDAQRWNTSLQARLGKIQGRGGGVGGTNDTSDTFSFTGDQTSYMSIYLGEHDELEGDIENLSLPELRRKVQELLEYVKELQAFNKDLQNKASLTENSVEQDKQDILTLSSQNKLLEKKLADAVKTNKALHDQLNRQGQKSAQNVIKPQVKDQKIQTSPEKERNSKASPQGNRAEHQGNKSSGIKPPGRKESTSASPDSEKTELDLEDQNVVETELNETSCRMETIGKELKTAEKPPCKDEGNNQNMEMEIASLRSLLNETGSASVIELRNELARLNNENTNLQSILKEMQSTEFKESCDDSGDGEIKKDLKKVVKRLKTELMDARKIIKLLKEQLELNSSMDSENSFNPDLIVSMAKEIDHLKKEHEASTKRRVILEKMLKEMEAQQPRGIDERDQRRNSQETLQRQEARIHSTPGSTIGAKSRLPVPVKSSKAAGNNNNNGANQNTEPDPQVEKLQSALQEKNKEYRELQESLCTAEFTLTHQKVNKTEATQTTDPSTDFNLCKQIDQLQKALQEKNQLNKELQELLCKAESALASQNTDRTGHLYKDLDHQQEQQEEKLQQALLVDQLQKGLQERNALNRQLEDRLSGAEACLNVNRTSASTNIDLDLHQLQKALQEKNQINKDLLERLHGAESIIEHLNGNKGVANQNEDMELHQQVNQLQKSLREKHELNKKLEERLSEAESTLTVLNANGASSSTNIDLDLRQLQKVLHEKNQINKDLLERLHKAESTIEHMKSSRAVANPNTDVNLYLQVDQLQKAILEKKQLYKELQDLLQTAESTIECQNATGTSASPNKELAHHQQVDQLQKDLQENNDLYKELHELLSVAQLTIACQNANQTSGPNTDLELHQQVDQLHKGLQEKNELNNRLQERLSRAEARLNVKRTSASTNTDLDLYQLQKALQEKNELNKQLEERLCAPDAILNVNRNSASTNTDLDLHQLEKVLHEKNQINKDLLEKLHRAESTVEHLKSRRAVANQNTDPNLYLQMDQLQKNILEKKQLYKELQELLQTAESTLERQNATGTLASPNKELDLHQQVDQLQKVLQEKNYLYKELHEVLHAAQLTIACLNANQTSIGPNTELELHHLVEQLQKGLQEKNELNRQLEEKLSGSEARLNVKRTSASTNTDLDFHQLQKALQEKNQINKDLLERVHRAESTIEHVNSKKDVANQNEDIELHQQIDQLQKALREKNELNKQLEQRLCATEALLNVNRASASTNTDLDLSQLQNVLHEKNQINKDLLEKLRKTESSVKHCNAYSAVANQNIDPDLQQQVDQLQKALQEKNELNKQRLSGAESTLTVMNPNRTVAGQNTDLHQLPKALHEKNQINKDLLERLHKAESTIEHLKSSRTVSNQNTDMNLQVDQLQKAILEKKQLYKELQELLQTAESTLEHQNATGTLASPNKELNLHQQVDQLQKALEEKNCLYKELPKLLRAAQFTITCLNANQTSVGPNTELHQQFDQLQKGLQEKNELNRQLEGKLSGAEARLNVKRTSASTNTDLDFHQLQKALQEKNQINKDLLERVHRAESVIEHVNSKKDVANQNEDMELHQQIDQLQKALREKNELNKQLEERLCATEALLNVNRTSASTNTDLDLSQLQNVLHEKNQINKDLLEKLRRAESIIKYHNASSAVANQNIDLDLHQQVDPLQKALQEKNELSKELEERLSEAESTLTVLNANGASTSTNIDLDFRQLQKVLHEKNQRLHKAESTIEHLKSSRAVANPNTDVSLYLQIDQLQKAILEKKQLYKELQELLQTAASTLECHNATGTLASPNKELDLHQQVDQLQKALEEKNCLHKELHELLRTAQLTIACLNANCTSTGPNADLELHQQLDQLQKGLQEKNELNKQLEGKLSGSEACQNAMRTSASTNTDLQHLQKALQEKNQINKDLLERLHKAESTIEHLNANRGVTNRNTELEVHQQIEKQQKAIQELNELNKQLEEKLFATEELLNENRTSASTNTNLDLQQLQKALEEKNHINKELLESLHRAESTIEDLTNNKGVDNWNTDGDLHRQVGELQKALKEKNKLNKQLEERLSEAESTFALELYQLQKDLQEKTEINKELQERLHAAESIIECLNDNPNQDTHLHQMVDQLRKTLQEKNQFCEKLKERLFTAESTTSHLNPNRAVNNENPDMDHLQQVDQLQKALQEKTQIVKQLQQRLHTAELALTHLNANRAVTKQSANLDLQKQVDQLQKALQQKKQINQELQQRLGTAESIIAHQNSNQKMHEAGTFLEQDDKEVQVDLQDLGYETCGKSENEVDREENRSTDDNQIKQHMNEASLPSLLKRDGQFFSMENLDTNSSTSYPSSSCLSSPKISMKSLQIYDDYGFTDDSDELKQQVMELKTKLENYQRVIHHLQSLLRRNSLSSDLLTIGSEPGQQTTVKLQEEHGDLEKDGQEMCSHKSLGLFSQDHSQNGSFPLGHDDEDKQMLKDEITSLKIELDKEKASNKNLLEQLHQLQSKIRSASPARFDSLVQSQARELSHLRQKIKDSRSLGTLHHHQLEDLNKSFEELLQASDVDYYVGKAFRGQLDKSLLVLGKLEERLECGDGYSDNEDNTLLEFAESPESLKHEITYLRKQLDSERRQLQKQLKDLARHNQNLAQATEEQLDVLSREVQEKNKVIQQLQVRNKSVELSTSHNSSDSEASDRYSRRILDSGSDTLHALQCRDGKYGQGRTSAGTKVPYGLQVEETAQPPGIISASTGKATVLGKENGGGSRRQSQTLLSTDTQILENKGGLAQQQRLQGLQRENSLLQEKLKNSEQLNETLRTEVDLHRSIINNREDAGEERGLSPKPQDRSSREDRASTGLTESRNEPSGLFNTDLLAEHLQEIRSLRQRLEESIRTNDRLREQLERRLAEAEPDPASTNIFIHGSEEQGQLANEVHFLWRQNQTLKDQLSLGSRDKQKENEKLRESLAKRNSKLEYLRNEYEHVKKEAVRLENKFRGSLEENEHLKEALHHSRDEINRLQSEIGIQRQQLSDSQHLLQSLRVELQVYEQLKAASDKRTVSDATSGQTQDASAPSHGPLDLSELLSEIRHLRIQLERSIQTNNALRQRLEEQLLRGQGKVEGSPSTININYLLSGEQRHSTLSNYGDNGSKSPAQDENFPLPSYRDSPKSGRSPPNRDGAKALHGVQEMKHHPTDELDSASQCSGSSADSTTHTPSRLVPGHRLWASRSGRHILGLIEDYNALRKQISEGKVLTCGMENNLQECFHAISQQGTESVVLDQRFLKGFSSDVNTMQQILEEASRLLKLLWKVSLPTNTSNSSSQNRQDEMMKTEIARLRSKLSQQERMLNGTVKRLRSTNRLKEGMEKVIIDQLAVTHNVLKKARGNLEAFPYPLKIQPLQEASVNGN
ncbi:myomegalin-like isoform X3 [Acipenser ruthenus]|uniref:myomegalin-like isoform X3 n=1 Tax=Acipenser ruthenus TaxID=7906 RepID=UPI002741A823|nr:myomegalin-like isoform X3 [Acipenser ruthenus]